jgi:hypothetical protein
MDKIDFLQECMSEFKGAPIDAFNREFCMLCSNRECSRSWANTSSFDARMKNWKTVLFDNVPRLNNTDAANPKFEIIETGRMPEVNAPTFETTPEVAPGLSYEDVSDTEPGTSTPSVQPTASAAAPATIPAQPPVLSNTPFNQPAMLRGAEPAEEKAEPGCVFVFEDSESND